MSFFLNSDGNVSQWVALSINIVAIGFNISEYKYYKNLNYNDNDNIILILIFLSIILIALYYILRETHFRNGNNYSSSSWNLFYFFFSIGILVVSIISSSPRFKSYVKSPMGQRQMNFEKEQKSNKTTRVI
jgi:hypothetical protein